MEASKSTEDQYIQLVYEKTISAYNDNCFHDADCLIIPKSRILESLMSAHKRSTSRLQKKIIENQLAFLPNFQEGIGNTPVHFQENANAEPGTAEKLRELAEVERTLYFMKLK